MDEEWARTQRDYVTWELTVIVVIKRTGALAVHTATVEVDEGEETALLIFPSRVDAQAHREDCGLFAGYGITQDRWLASKVWAAVGGFG